MFRNNFFTKRWLQLSSTEKKIVMILGILVTIVLYFLLVWYPLNTASQDIHDRITQQQKLNIWLSQATAQINELRNNKEKPKTIKNNSLLSIVDAESKINTWAKAVTSIKQGENNQVEVTFDKINFDDLMGGLEQLWQKYNIQATKVFVQRIKSTNQVHATLNLQQ